MRGSSTGQKEQQEEGQEHKQEEKVQEHTLHPLCTLGTSTMLVLVGPRPCFLEFAGREYGVSPGHGEFKLVPTSAGRAGKRKSSSMGSSEPGASFSPTPTAAPLPLCPVLSQRCPLLASAGRA